MTFEVTETFHPRWRQQLRYEKKDDIEFRIENKIHVEIENFIEENHDAQADD